MSILPIKTPRVFAPLLADKTRDGEAVRYLGAYGGRGSGKSHFFAELGVERCLLRPGSRGVCIREIQKSLKESAKRLIEDKIEALGVQKHFRILNDHIVTPGSGIILFQGMQDHTAESIKSLEGFDWAWNEEAQTTSERSLEMLRPTIRSEGSQIWFSWNPRNKRDPVDAFLRGIGKPENSITVRANYNDNPFFPSVLEAERQQDMRSNPHRYAHIWLGEYEPSVLGAIWTKETINEHRRTDAPPIERLLVAIDPAISHEDGSNEHGIMVGGIGADQRGYLLDDFTVKGKPHEWARKAIEAYDRYEADAIVIEINQGGDMVRHTLNSIRPNLPIIEVRATRGKHVRAEPISALYSMGSISHVGVFPELEEQMCQMTANGYQGDGSPDRVDAMVWLFTELFPAMTQRQNSDDEYDERAYAEPDTVSGY